MPTFDQVIGRADNALLQRYVGSDAVRIIQALDPRNERPGLIREIFRRLRSPYDVLLDATWRNELIDLLRQNEAQVLADGLRLYGDPYQALKEHRFSKGSGAFRLWCSFLIARASPRTTRRGSSSQEVEALYGLFPHQQVAVASVYFALDSGSRRAVLHMPTGAGKTRMAMHVVCRFLIETPNSTVIWLANSEELCDQAAEEFQKAWSFLGNRTVMLTRVWGQHQPPHVANADG